MGRKHCGKRRNCSSNFSFSHCVFKRLVSQGHQKVSLCGNGLKENDYSLPKEKFLDWFKLKAFADDKRNAIEKLKFVLGRGENIIGKGENAGYQHFLLFPQCFQKASYSRLLKVMIVW